MVHPAIGELDSPDAFELGHDKVALTDDNPSKVIALSWG